MCVEDTAYISELQNTPKQCVRFVTCGQYTGPILLHIGLPTFLPFNSSRAPQFQKPLELAELDVPPAFALRKDNPSSRTGKTLHGDVPTEPVESGTIRPTGSRRLPPPPVPPT